MGLSPADASKYTLRTWMDIIDGREMNQANQCITTAWFTACYTRMNTMPQLDKAMIKETSEFVKKDTIADQKIKALKKFQEEQNG